MTFLHLNESVLSGVYEWVVGLVISLVRVDLVVNHSGIAVEQMLDLIELKEVMRSLLGVSLKLFELRGKVLSTRLVLRKLKRIPVELVDFEVSIVELYVGEVTELVVLVDQHIGHLEIPIRSRQLKVISNHALLEDIWNFVDGFDSILILNQIN